MIWNRTTDSSTPCLWEPSRPGLIRKIKINCIKTRAAIGSQLCTAHPQSLALRRHQLSFTQVDCSTYQRWFGCFGTVYTYRYHVKMLCLSDVFIFICPCIVKDVLLHVVAFATAGRVLCLHLCVIRYAPCVISGKRDSIHHHLLEVTFETATVPESRQKLLDTTRSGWWWCIESVFRVRFGRTSSLIKMVPAVKRVSCILCS